MPSSTHKLWSCNRSSWCHWWFCCFMSMCSKLIPKKYRAIICFIWIHSYNFILSPIFNNHHNCMSSTHKLWLWDQIMFQVLWMSLMSLYHHCPVSCYMSMCRQLIQKIQNSLMFHMNLLIPFTFVSKLH